MKIFKILTIALCLLPRFLNAQILKFGVKGGLNIYHQTNGPNKSVTGYHAGIVIQKKLIDRLVLQSEALYSTEGSESIYYVDPRKTMLNYINVPLLLQYMVSKNFAIEAGPQMGFLTSGQITDRNFFVTDAKGTYRNFDYGLNTGLSYINLKSGFGLDTRYYISIPPVNKNRHSSHAYRNCGFQAGIFYLIRHK